jgi:hypothetical protein
MSKKPALISLQLQPYEEELKPVKVNRWRLLKAVLIIVALIFVSYVIILAMR